MKITTCTSGSVPLIIFTPEDPNGSCVLALHGSGRGSADYSDTPFYARQRDIALEKGYAFAVFDNGRDTYGTDRGVENTAAAVTELKRRIAYDRLFLWATSAGGVCAFRYAAENRDGIAGIIGTFPVFDLLSVFDILASCRRAYNAEGKTIEEFADMIRGKNPVDLADRLKGLPIWVSHGNADRAVPYEANAVKLSRLTGAYLHTVENGVHGTENYAYYDIVPHLALK